MTGDNTASISRSTRRNYTCIVCVDQHDTLYGICLNEPPTTTYRVLPAKSQTGKAIPCLNVREGIELDSPIISTIPVGGLVETTEEFVLMDDGVEIYRLRVSEKSGGGFVSFNSHCNQILLKEVKGSDNDDEIEDLESPPASSSPSSSGIPKFCTYGYVDKKEHEDLWKSQIGLGERMTDFLMSKGSNDGDISSIIFAISDAIDDMYSNNELFLNLEEFFLKRGIITHRVDFSTASAVSCFMNTQQVPSMILHLGYKPTISVINTRQSNSSHLNIFQTDFCHQACIMVEKQLGYTYPLNHACNLRYNALANLSADQKSNRIGRAIAAALPLYLYTFGTQPRFIHIQGVISIGLDWNVIAKSMNMHMDPAVREELRARTREGQGLFDIVQMTSLSFDNSILTLLLGTLQYINLRDQGRVSSIPVKTKEDPRGWFFSNLKLFTDEK